MFKNIIFTLVLFLFISSCETMTSVKRGLTGEKIKSTDEFFVKKKDPLILPPNYESLPTPLDIEEFEQEALSIEKKLVENSSSDINSNERSILNQIKNK